MRTIVHLLFLSIFTLSLSGCLKDECDATRVFIRFEPIYRTTAQIRADVRTEKPRELKNPGKIYLYGNYILINERNEGIHVIDNTDNRNPVNVSFINLPGNVDMAVRGNMLYADCFINLFTLNISNSTNPVVTNVVENAFPSLGFNQSLGHIVGYREVEIIEDAPCDWRNGWFENQKGGGGFYVDRAFAADFSLAHRGNVSGPSVNGIGGSMARFTLYDHYLYTVDNSSLRVFDVQNAEKPEQKSTVPIGWGIETIYPYEQNLFIGSRTGMYIFDNSNPLKPTQLSVFQHARACDPVFVEGDLAYVTLHAGTPCDGNQNQLDIIDVKDLKNPKLLKTHPMHRPNGLSVVDGIVYLCEDDEGLKVLNAKNWNKLDLLSHLKHFTAYDVIALQNTAIVIGKNGFYQYDITNPAKLKELSRIPVVN